MNLFVTSECPRESAIALDDKRVGKLLMEANQMLSLAVKIHHENLDWFEHVGPGKISDGFAHKNHPVSMWVRKTRENFRWCMEHAYHLADEFKLRFGKKHGSASRTPYIANFVDCIPDGPLMPFQNSARNNSLRVDFSHLPVPLSYREYLLARWPGDTYAPKWTNRGAPEWA